MSTETTKTTIPIETTVEEIAGRPLDLGITIVNDPRRWFAHTYAGPRVRQQNAVFDMRDHVHGHLPSLDAHRYALLSALRSLSPRVINAIRSHAYRHSRRVSIAVTSTRPYATEEFSLFGDLSNVPRAGTASGEKLRQAIKDVFQGMAVEDMPPVVTAHTVSNQFLPTYRAFKWAANVISHKDQTRSMIPELLIPPSMVASFDNRTSMTN
jgi:hypothetical protein